MKSFISVMFVVVAVNVSLAQTPSIEASLSDAKLEQCRRAQHLYELDFEGTFEFSNTSNETILVPRNVDVVRSVVAAPSPQELKDKHYTFVVVQEFGGNASDPEARLEDFVVLKPGGKAAVQIGLVLPASTDLRESGTSRLRPGKHWLQLEFLTLPFSLWNGGNFELWKKKWSSTGTLMDKYLVTDPFPLNVVPDANAANCNGQESPIVK